MGELKVGDPAPPFELPDQDGKVVRLSDYAGRKLLVYFYPKAGTSGCTAQACSVRDALPDLAQLGTDVVGISPDKPDAQAKFDRSYTLGFPLLSDPDHRVAEAYGVWREKSNYGKRYMGVVRSSFLVGEDGVLQGVWYGVSPAKTVPSAIEALKA
ncbi:MAG: thioredoxin-dependent thiol peroxidase [Actinomycetota bacterium]|nr:thioredoxin-dependent thiol peroxidase [Actinomycetota bacterium]